MRKGSVLLVSAVAALVLSGTSFAVVKTTAPGSRVDVYIQIYEQRFAVTMLTQSQYRGAQEMFQTDPSEVTRGQVARFTVLNTGTKPHNFTLFGHTTKTLAPGGKIGTCPRRSCAVFVVPLVKRGSFPYKVIVNGNKKLRGTFLVQ